MTAPTTYLPHHHRPILILTALLGLSGTPAVAAPAEFSARAVVSKDHYFETKWSHTPAHDGVSVASATRFYRGESVIVLVFLNGMATGPDGVCDVTFDLRFFAPGETEPDTVPNLAGLHERLAVPGNVYLADSIVEVTFEDSDRLGDYRVEVVAHDRVAGRDARGADPFALIEYGADSVDLNQDEAFARITTYYQRPEPHLFLELLREIGRARLTEHGMPVALGPFFRQVLKDNPYHLPHLRAYLAALAEDERAYLLPMLAGAIHDAPDLLRDVPDPAAARAAVAACAYPDIWAGRPTDPGQLDMLWTQFFATGDIVPVRKIATALTAEERASPFEVAVTGAARWSLESNCVQHPLVHAYCDDLARHDSELPDAIRAQLAEIVRAAEKRKPASENANSR